MSRGEIGCFITLTYNDEHCPEDCSISKRELQLFIKRLRKNTGAKFTYYACGEYGDLNGRPHYHINIFGWEPDDVYETNTTKSGFKIHKSRVLEKCWSRDGNLIGHCDFGTITMDSCSYVAKYTMKKITGDAAEEHYRRFDSLTGESFTVEPEFQLFSKQLGIDWLRQYYTDWFTFQDESTGTCVIKGKELPVPKYYIKKLEGIDAERYAHISANRESFAERQSIYESKANVSQLIQRGEAKAREIRLKSLEKG